MELTPEQQALLDERVNNAIREYQIAEEKKIAEQKTQKEVLEAEKRGEFEVLLAEERKKAALLQSQLDDAKRSSDLNRVLAETGFPAELAGFITGKTPDDMKSQIKALNKYIKPVTPNFEVGEGKPEIKEPEKNAYKQNMRALGKYGM